MDKKMDEWEVELYSPQHGDSYHQTFEFPKNTSTFKVIHNINNANGGGMWRVANLKKVRRGT